MEKEKVLEAVNTLKKLCEEMEDCDECPIRGGNSGCYVRDGFPADWEIEPHEKWKVFK